MFSPQRLWLRLVALSALLLLRVPFGWASLTSDLLIPARQQFVLGGEQRGAFKVSARNVGKVPVQIRERQRNGGIFTKTTLAPGASGIVRFEAGSTALLLNPADEQARMYLKVTGDTELGMRYEESGKR